MAKQHNSCENRIVKHDHRLKVSLEFGHTMLASDGSLDYGELQYSCEVTNGVRAKLVAQNPDVEISSVLLVDDKKICPEARREQSYNLMAFLKGFTTIDYYCYERDLVAYVKPMLACLTGRVKRSQERSIKRRFAQGIDTLSCPVDIAIWHLLRLGVLKDTERIMQPVDACRDFQSVDLAVSVLPSYLRIPEENAVSRILRHVPKVHNRVEPIYFDVPHTYSSTHASDDMYLAA